MLPRHAYRATRGRRFKKGGGPAHFPTANPLFLFETADWQSAQRGGMGITGR
jgi:hypothetical protein